MNKDPNAMLIDSPKSYEERRQELKISVGDATLILFKAVVGLGLLVTQFDFGKCGVILGTLITIFACFLTGYTKYLVLNITNKIEEERDDGSVVENYDKVVELTLGNKMRVFTKISCFIFNTFACIVLTINFSKFIHSELTQTVVALNGFDLQYFQAILYMLTLIFIFILLEPEKLKYPCLVGTFVLIFAIVFCWLLNLKTLLFRKESVNISYFNPAFIPALLGNMLSSSESVTTIFTIRSTMKEPKKMTLVLQYTFMLIIGFFLICGISCLYVR